LVFRLLTPYPSEKLVVIEPNLNRSIPERRLTNVPYHVLDVGRASLLNTRFHRLASSWYTRTAGNRAAMIPRLYGDFTPQALLTVAHGYSWIAAAQFARQSRLPLHLIVHDDWPRQVNLIEPVQSWLNAQFGRIYRQAASRLCVS